LEPILFLGGDPSSTASGYVTTYSNGSISSAVLTNGGSNFKSVPILQVKTANGSGAVLTAEVSEFNTSVKITGKVIKNGVGRRQGYLSTTRCLLNSDKYIQDSYFYQDYSYLIRAASTLDKYKDILYNTFHTAGSELFGQFYDQIEEESKIDILYEPYRVTYFFGGTGEEITFIISADTDELTADDLFITADQVP
jgi:hypothetical protein